MYQAPQAIKALYSRLDTVRAGVFLLTMLCAIAASAQLRKGQKLYDEGRYADALKPLKKEFFDSDQNIKAGVLLAKCYYQLHDYQEALDAMGNIGERRLPTFDDKRFYADVLIANDNFQEAYVSLYKLLQEDKDEAKTRLWIEKVNQLIKWDSVGTVSKVDIVQGINSIYNEYGPYVNHDGELWFVSDIANIQTVFPASYNNQNLHLYYKTKSKGQGSSQVRKPVMLIKNKEYYYHDGPLDQWEEQGKYALTLRDIDAPEIGGTIGIYFSTLSGTEEELEPFPYNEKSNNGHPTFCHAGRRMIFSSDRAGGYGQMDLWYSDYTNGNWEPPVNLGPIVNTPLNEVFPNYQESRLYFSSDRRDMGYGGLDIYYSSELYDYAEIYNLRAPINSAYDDFALTFKNAREGFHTSNRKYGTGGDDIYAIAFYPEQPIINDITLQVADKNIPEGTLLEVYDSEGTLVASAATNKIGQIEVATLKAREVYTLKVKNQKIDSNTELLVFAKNGDKLGAFRQSGPGEFKFELLPIEDYLLVKQKVDDESSLGYELDGRVIAADGVPVVDVDVAVKDPQGAILAQARTAADGRFKMMGLKPNENYIIETAGMDAYHEIDVYGKSGAISHSIKPLGKNKFAYTRTAPSNNMSRAEIVVPNVLAIVINNETGEKSKLVLFDSNDQEIRKPSSDEDGFISMGSLTAGKAYRLNIADKKLGPADWLVLLDNKGDTAQTVRPFDANNFFFEYMMYSDYGSDEIVDVNTDIYTMKIDDQTLQAGTPFLFREKDGAVIDTLYSDTNGELHFNDLNKKSNYEVERLDKNFTSEKTMRIYDVNNAVVFQGVSENLNVFRFQLLEAVDFALTKDDSDDMSILRFGLTGKIALAQPSQTRLQIFDADNEYLAETNTSTSGAFLFDGLKAGKKYIVKPNLVKGNQLMKVVKQEEKDSLRVERSADGNYYINFDMPDTPSITLVSNSNKISLGSGSSFNLNDVYYDFNSYILKSTSRESLNKLAKLMSENPDIAVEIKSHTDSRGPTNYNQMLSQRRADAVVHYLQAKGIDTSRLKASGKGEKDLSNKCADGIRCTEGEHAANRRTEFVILGSL